MVRRANAWNLSLLLLFQIAFDYISSYVLNPYGIQQPLLKALLVYRLNYWVLHYVFIFVLGGWLAVHMEEFHAFMQRRRLGICVFFWGSMAALLGYYYHLLFQTGYTPIEAVNTAHQLSPAGIFYTIGASLFFFTIFTYQRFPSWLNPLLSALGRHSYFAYLVHPVFITYITLFMQAKGIIMTAPLAIAFYLAITLLAVGAAAIFRHLGNTLPLINILTIGVYPKRKNA